jgi:peptidoglycan/xylan/chitin deacetylase (PgdA/CDA1 family)
MLRLDRLASLAIVAPLRRMRYSDKTSCVPVLMYHSVSESHDDRCHPYLRTTTSPTVFARHMRILSQLGYSAMTLGRAVECVSAGLPPVPTPPKTVRQKDRETRRAVVLTFDDGFRDFYTHAAPILEQFAFSATIFLSTGFLGRRFINGSPCLAGDEVLDLTRRGFEFGSHTVSHPQLRELSRDRLIYEIAASRDHIEALTGRSAYLFSYPYRFPEEDIRFVRALRQLLLREGYRAGVTTAIGRFSGGDDPLFIRRLPVNDCDDYRLFRAKLLGDYDWLHGMQLGFKMLRRAARMASNSLRNVHP